MTNLIKIKKGTVKSWPSKLKASLIARGEGNPYEEVVTKLMGDLPDLTATIAICLDEDQTPKGAHYKLLGRPIQVAIKAKAIWNEGPKDAKVILRIDPDTLEFPATGDQRGLSQWQDVFESGEISASSSIVLFTRVSLQKSAWQRSKERQGQGVLTSCQDSEMEHLSDSP